MIDRGEVIGGPLSELRCGPGDGEVVRFAADVIGHDLSVFSTTSRRREEPWMVTEERLLDGESFRNSPIN